MYSFIYPYYGHDQPLLLRRRHLKSPVTQPERVRNNKFKMADFEMPLAISFQNKCSFFLKRKNRYCKMIPGKGKKFCGEHSYLELGQNEVLNECNFF